MTESYCIEDGCTQPAEVERPATTEVVELVCPEHEASSND